jgi:hypothetical protein
MAVSYSQRTDFPAGRRDFGPHRHRGCRRRLARPAVYAARANSAATIRAYVAGWRVFLAFCAPRGLSGLPATDWSVAAYPAALADRGARAATIPPPGGHLQAHRRPDLPSSSLPATYWTPWCAEEQDQHWHPHAVFASARFREILTAPQARGR